MYQRPLFDKVIKRLKEPRKFIQVLAGPRQVGKTTLITQVCERLSTPYAYASADGAENHLWIEQQWQAARLRLAGSPKEEFLLVLDEIQKVPGWTDAIKRLWDEDSREKRAIKLVILGSSPLLIKSGLSESLGGRFELIRCTHWGFAEMRDAFGIDLDHYLFFGGYPGTAGLIGDEKRWRSYVREALIETTISKDVLLLNRIDKPALLRTLFLLGAGYSGRILSYTKMQGQLQDAGNTTTLAHYLSLLDGAGMLTGLEKYATQGVRRRGSSPKLQVYNNALFSAVRGDTFTEVRHDPERWGRTVESAVGSFLQNEATARDLSLFYWRESDAEVDFVLTKGDRLAAIEVKSGAVRERPAGLDMFVAMTKKKVRPYLVGSGGIPLDEFFSIDLDALF
ncbi:MAG TPA: ATP-binding protein [bacterium]|nr:ATP-binding protein [bacterium]